MVVDLKVLLFLLHALIWWLITPCAPPSDPDQCVLSCPSGPRAAHLLSVSSHKHQVSPQDRRSLFNLKILMGKISQILPTDVLVSSNIKTSPYLSISGFSLKFLVHKCTAFSPSSPSDAFIWIISFNSLLMVNCSWFSLFYAHPGLWTWSLHWHNCLSTQLLICVDVVQKIWNPSEIPTLPPASHLPCCV